LVKGLARWGAEMRRQLIARRFARQCGDRANDAAENGELPRAETLKCRGRYASRAQRLQLWDASLEPKKTGRQNPETGGGGRWAW